MQKDNSKKVLFIDDEPLYAKSYGDALTAAGYEVFNAKNGEQALELLNSEKFSLLIVDLIMPILSGISFLKKIRHKKVPIIILTTLEGETDREDALKYGATLFLKKGETSGAALVKSADKITS